MAVTMDRAEFVKRYGAIYEHSPWVAEQAFDELQGNVGTESVAAVMANCVERAGQERKLELILAHPDLGGRAAIAGGLTPDSDSEQSSAGIDQCTPDEFARFTDLNERYRRKFGFPFIMAVRNSNRHAILAAFAERLGNDADAEFAEALRQIHKIARLRLEALGDD